MQENETKINIRKSTKTALVMAAVLFIIGFGCCLAALCMGFSMSDLKQFSHLAERSRVDFTEQYTEVEDLELDLGVGECRVIPWTGDFIKVSGENLTENFSCEQRDENLKIRCKDNTTVFLEIYVPEEQVFDEVKLTAGVGVVKAQRGALRCNVLKLDSGAGSCRIAADILEKAEIESGIGEVVLILTGDENDFDYDLECGAGIIRIGDIEISGPGQDWKQDNDAEKKIEAECGIGTLNIEFTE